MIVFSKQDYWQFIRLHSLYFACAKQSLIPTASQGRRSVSLTLHFSLAKIRRTRKSDSPRYHPYYKEPTGINPIGSLWSGRRGSCLGFFALNESTDFALKNYRSFRKSPPLSAKNPQLAKKLIQSTISIHKKDPSYDESSLWSGRRGSNSRHPPWQGLLVN